MGETQTIDHFADPGDKCQHCKGILFTRTGARTRSYTCDDCGAVHVFHGDYLAKPAKIRQISAEGTKPYQQNVRIVGGKVYRWQFRGRFAGLRNRIPQPDKHYKPRPVDRMPRWKDPEFGGWMHM